MQDYHPGFHMHFIHARRLGETPWGWRSAVVTSVDGLSATAAYVTEDGSVTFWHHRPIPGLEVAAPVRVHEQLHAVEIGDEWHSVRIDSGIGAVPMPEAPELWAAEMGGAIVDLATGTGLRVLPEVARDHEDPER